MTMLAPCLGERQHDRLADAAVAAGDDGDLAVESHVGSPSGSSRCVRRGRRPSRCAPPGPGRAGWRWNVLVPRKSHAHERNASTRWCTPLISQACTPEPGGEGDVAVQLVVVSAHLGDGGAAADHRHDALVLVVERFARLAVDVGAGCSSPPTARPAGPPTELGEHVAVGVGDVGDVADGVHVGEALDGEVGPARRVGRPGPVGRPEVVGQRRRLDAAGPHDDAGEDLGAVAERDAVGGDLGDAGASLQRHAVVLQLARRRSRGPCRRRRPSTTGPWSTR